jgi:hypothetical protein
MKVASFFDYTGNALKPWLDNGYECHLFDIQHPPGHNIRDDGFHTYGIDLSTAEDALFYRWLTNIDNIAFASFFPPCQNLSVSGARWFKGKGLRALQQSIGFFATCTEIAEKLDCPYFIENPMSTISSYWREPDHKFNPSDYSGYVDGAEDYTKQTWLWTGNGWDMPPRNRAGDLFDEPDRTYIHHQAPGPERANIRSATPNGFAIANYLHNSKRVNNEQQGITGKVQA